MNNEKVFAAVRKLTGHRPVNDVHRINYAKISVSELWKYYKELYYNLSVLTDEQKKMVGLVDEKSVLKPMMSTRQVSMISMDANIAMPHQETAMRTHTITPVMVYTGLLN